MLDILNKCVYKDGQNICDSNSFMDGHILNTWFDTQNILYIFKFYNTVQLIDVIIDRKVMIFDYVVKTLYD